MGVAAAAKKLFGQRNQRDVRTGAFSGLIHRTRSRRQNPGAANWLLQSNAGGARENELVVRFAFSAESLVSGILGQRAGKISLGTKVTRCGKGIEREVIALSAFQRVVAPVVNEGKTGTADSRRQRQYWHQIAGKVGGEVARLYPAIVEAVRGIKRGGLFFLWYEHSLSSLSFQHA